MTLQPFSVRRKDARDCQVCVLQRACGVAASVVDYDSSSEYTNLHRAPLGLAVAKDWSTAIASARGLILCLQAQDHVLLAPVSIQAIAEGIDFTVCPLVGHHLHQVLLVGLDAVLLSDTEVLRVTKTYHLQCVWEVGTAPTAAAAAVSFFFLFIITSQESDGLKVAHARVQKNECQVGHCRASFQLEILLHDNALHPKALRCKVLATLVATCQFSKRKGGGIGNMERTRRRLVLEQIVISNCHRE
mmetsp:Transcript_4937/g.8783  ORF Transcript_4937/g.8783 Transcript_4937/m.8783 type:complete len:245 (+) Transcript_4937:197-931(+)